MAEGASGGFGARIGRALNPAALKAKAEQAAATLKAEYEAGKRGEDGPSPKLWGTPREQADALAAWLRDARTDAGGAPVADDAAAGQPAAETAAADEAEQVATALRGVDWTAVKAATRERGGEAAVTMRAMADQVDWDRVQPVAARVSTSLIAAVASGRIGIGGPLGPMLARAIIDQGGLGQQVASRLGSDPAVPDDLGDVVRRGPAPG